MRKWQQLRKFVLALSGAHEEVLELVPSERARFESLGWAVLITTGMAVISMWFALATALGVNGILAVPVALFWGLVIMGIDRWLITSMPVDGSRKFALAVPRLLLALLLGTLISTPLVLRIFQTEINAQMATMQQANYSTFLQQQQNSLVDQQVTTYGQELDQLNTVIASRGAQTGNAAADPQLVAYNNQLAALDSQLTKWTQLKNQYYQDYTCQKYGGADCPRAGVGPAAQASLTSYNQAAAEVARTQGQITTVQGEIQQRDAQLNSTSKAAQQIRYDQAVTALPVVRGEYDTAVQRRNQLQASYYAQEQAAHGILMRLEALSELSSQSPTVAGARLLLFLLFLVIECLPVTVKLLQRPGQYEAALAEAVAAERRDFKKAFAGRSRLGGGYPAGPGPAVLRLRPEPELAAEPERGVSEIWRGGTRVLPITAAGDFEDERPTESFPGPRPAGGGPGSPTRFDAAPGTPPGGGATARPRHWRGADAYRNFWTERDEDDDQEQAPPAGPAPDPAPDEPPLALTRHDMWLPARTRVDHQPAYDTDGNGTGIPLHWDDE